MIVYKKQDGYDNWEKISYFHNWHNLVDYAGSDNLADSTDEQIGHYGKVTMSGDGKYIAVGDSYTSGTGSYDSYARIGAAKVFVRKIQTMELDTKLLDHLTEDIMMLMDMEVLKEVHNLVNVLH